MKLKVWTISIAALLNLVLALSPYLPYTKEVWQQKDPQAFYAALAALIGIDFVLLTIAVGLQFIYEAKDNNKFRQELLSKLNGSETRRLSAQDFYKEFSSACKAASFSVSICYLSGNPPTQGAHDFQIKYYQEQLKLVKNSPNITFRRIVRLTPNNEEWIRKLRNDFTGKSNFYLAVLQDLPAEVEMPLALSVQIVDDEKVWFVALDSHQPEGQYRDLYLRGRDVGAAMTEYYKRLWDMSTIVLRGGVVTEEGKAI